MTEQYVDSNGIRLAYEEIGDPSHPAIVLIMGLGTQMIAWPEEFCLGLAADGYRVVRFDNRDIGLSQKMNGHSKPWLPLAMLLARLNLPVNAPYDLHDMTADTLGLLDALNIDTAHFVGASMGGMIAQLIAANYPDRTLTLTSIMSTSGDRSLPGPARALAAHMTRRPSGGQDAYLTYAMETWRLIGSPDYPQSDNVLREKVLRSYRRSYHPAGFARQLAAIIASGDRVNALKRILAPTLVIHGKDDPLIPVAGGIDTARHVPYATLELIDGMGHDLPHALVPRIVDMIVSHANTHTNS